MRVSMCECPRRREAIDARGNKHEFAFEKKRKISRKEHAERRVYVCVCVCGYARRRKRQKWDRKNAETLPSQNDPEREMGLKEILSRRERVKKYKFLFFFILRARTGWQGFVAMPLSVTHPFCLYKN